MTKLSDLGLRRIVVGLCLLAAIRVFIFAAAFPFFNNVDEQAHVDLVLKYAHGDVPRGITNFSAEAARYFADYSTPEYFVDPKTQPYPPPTWTLSTEEQEQLRQEAAVVWQSRPNHESGEPPLYYSMAAGWLSIGHAFHVRGARLLYWTRFLNIAMAAGLVWVGYLVARSASQDRHFQVAVPLLLAIWPQSAFYSIAGDALSPLCFGICLLRLIKLFGDDRPTISRGVWIGLSLAATCLTKTGNIPLLFVVAISVALALRNFQGHRAWLMFGAFLISAATPIGTWFGWNYRNFGDLTATQSKIQLLSWTLKPVADWWSHPIFTFDGAIKFWSELLASFWRGEFIWHGQRLSWPPGDIFYWVSSALVAVVAIIVLLAKSRTSTSRNILLLAWFTVVSLVAFQILLSIRFDFGNSPYPSREHPYFTSGRLLNAGAVPFFLIYAVGIDRLKSLTKSEQTRSITIWAVALFIVGMQICQNAPAFSSQYNFFHIPAF